MAINKREQKAIQEYLEMQLRRLGFDAKVSLGEEFKEKSALNEDTPDELDSLMDDDYFWASTAPEYKQ